MKCIDFDKAFSLFALNWFKQHAADYADYDAMEAALPDVYAAFLDAPADFLAGEKPSAYFDSWDDPKLLIDWMEDYYKQRVPVPDLLLDRIVTLGEGAGKRLYALLQKERAPIPARMTAINLLREMDSRLPLYISWQLRREADDELCDAACESLAQMGEEAIEPMLAFLADANDAGKEALCGVLSYYPDDSGKVLPELLRLIRLPGANIALLASYLGRLGEEDALETLIDLALDDDLRYLDYIELRSAIEQLGGDAPEREFNENDPDYEAMNALQLRALHQDGQSAADAVPEAPANGEYLQ